MSSISKPENGTQATQLPPSLSPEARMPEQLYEQKILRRRAIHLAQKQRAEKQTEDEMFLHILLGKNENYGIPYGYLDEILRPRPITPIPNTPKSIVGTIPYRGGLIAVLNLAEILETPDLPEQHRNQGYWLVVVTANNMNLALLVNKVHGNYHYRNEELSPSLDISQETPTGSIHGIFDGKIAILDLSTLLSADRLKLEKRI